MAKLRNLLLGESQKLAAQGIPVTENKLTEIVRQVYGGIGEAAAIIPVYAAGGPAALPTIGAISGFAEEGTAGGAVLGGIEGALLQNMIHAIGMLPSKAQLPTWFGMGAAITPGGVQDRVVGGLTWTGLGISGRTGRPKVTVKEFLERYPTIQNRVDDIAATKVLEILAPDVSPEIIESYGGPKKMLETFLTTAQEKSTAPPVVAPRPAPEPIVPIREPPAKVPTTPKGLSSKSKAAAEKLGMGPKRLTDMERKELGLPTFEESMEAGKNAAAIRRHKGIPEPKTPLTKAEELERINYAAEIENRRMEQSRLRAKEGDAQALAEVADDLLRGTGQDSQSIDQFKRNAFMDGEEAKRIAQRYVKGEVDYASATKSLNEMIVETAPEATPSKERPKIKFMPQEDGSFTVEAVMPLSAAKAIEQIPRNEALRDAIENIRSGQGRLEDIDILGQAPRESERFNKIIEELRPKIDKIKRSQLAAEMVKAEKPRGSIQIQQEMAKLRETVETLREQGDPEGLAPNLEAQRRALSKEWEAAKTAEKARQIAPGPKTQPPPVGEAGAGKIAPQIAKEPVSAMAHAGEAVSAESLARAKAVEFALVDERTGRARPLVGVDAVDVVPGLSEVKVQRNKINGKAEILEAGTRVSPAFVQQLGGKLDAVLGQMREKTAVELGEKTPAVGLSVEALPQRGASLNNEILRLTSGRYFPKEWAGNTIEEIADNRQNLARFVIENYDPAMGQLENYINANKKFFIRGTKARQLERLEEQYPEPEARAMPEVSAFSEESRPKNKPPVEPELAAREAPAEDMAVLNILRKTAQNFRERIGGTPEFEDNVAEILKSRILESPPEPMRSLEARLGMSRARIQQINKELTEVLRSDPDVIKIVQKRIGKLPGNRLDTALDSMREKTLEELGEKTPPVGLSLEIKRNRVVKTDESKFAFPEEQEALYQEAKTLPELSRIDKAKKFLVDLKHNFTRTYRDLPVKGEFIELKQSLKRLEKAPITTQDKAIRIFREITRRLNPEENDLVNRGAILYDLRHEADVGHRLPFGFTPEMLEETIGKFEASISANPKAQAAIEARSSIWDSIRDDYVFWRNEVGHDVTAVQANPDYFRHKIIEYADEKSGRTGSGRKLRVHVGQEFLKARGGSEKSILADWVAADYEVLQRMLYDIEEAKAIKNIRSNFDKSAEFKAKAKEQGVALEEVIPEGYATWQPREGHAFYMADSLPSKIAEKIIDGSLNEMGVVRDKLRKSLAMGRERETWIVKEEVANTLDNLKRPVGRELPEEVFRYANLGWKRWVLLNPRRFLKYNTRNLSGDADKVFVGNMSGFTKAPRAFRELYDVFYGDKIMPEDMRDFHERGGFSTTLQAQEIGDIKYLPEFKSLYEKSTLNDVNVFKKYWGMVGKATNLRESILRYGNYLDYLEQMKSDPEGRPKNFGASIPEEIMGLKDIKDRAFRLSNELLGAYDEISPAGQYIREKIFPFWSWKELNTRSYVRLIKNAARNPDVASKAAGVLLTGVKMAPGTAIRVGRFAIKATGLWALLTAYNNILFKEEEKELPQDVRDRPHIILGRAEDGTVRYFSRLGAIGDFLEWFGLDAAPHHIADLLNGKKSIKDVAEEMAKSPVNVIAQGISPFLKTPMEVATRRSLFPDVFKPGLIRDRLMFLAKALDLDNEYKAVSGKPTPGYLRSASKAFIYEANPYENSYHEFHDIKRQYLKKEGKSAEGFWITPRGDALYNLKLSYRYGDKEKAEKYMQRYIQLVVMDHKGDSADEIVRAIQSGLRSSFESMHPLSGIAEADRKRFVALLDDEEKTILMRALKFYNDTLLGASETKQE